MKRQLVKAWDLVAIIALMPFIVFVGALVLIADMFDDWRHS